MDTVIEYFWNNVTNYGDKSCVWYKKDGIYNKLTNQKFGQNVYKLFVYLKNLNLKNYSKIAILSNSRYEWMLSDLAILSLSHVTVPVYPTLTSEEVYYILDHSQSSVAILENVNQLEKINIIKKDLKELKHVIIIDSKNFQAQDYANDENFSIKTLDEIQAQDIKIDFDIIKETLPKIDNLASIIYTSGTTGNPKGVMISHQNLEFICDTILSQTDIDENDVILSFLPLSHVYERVGGEFLSVKARVPIAFSESMDQVAKNLIEVKPTYINAVPRFYEKVYQMINNEIKKMPQASRFIAKWAINLGKRVLLHSDNNDTKLIQNLYKTELRIADRLVYKKIRNRLGGRLRFMTSGAAPLALDIQYFFKVIGLDIMEGYGLTETCAPVSCNFPGNYKIGTVGKPLPGIELKFSEEGELMVRGKSVFVGYYNDPSATEAAFKDGWFMTGDIGELDSDGYLKILDRKKDLIITSGGKHVAPQYLENLFKEEKLISNVIAYGDYKKYITAIICLNHEELAKFAKENSIKYEKIDELFSNDILKSYIGKIIEDKNQHLASFERIKKFAILTTELSIESGDLTPTLKVKRKVVLDKYKHLLEDLYDKEDTLL